jgi:hypothetical protein
MLATDEQGIPLVLTGAERAESGAKLVYLPSVLRPIPRPLRGDRALIRTLRLSKQVADRS